MENRPTAEEKATDYIKRKGIEQASREALQCFYLTMDPYWEEVANKIKENGREKERISSKG
jgi:hypothetical protein